MLSYVVNVLCSAHLAVWCPLLYYVPLCCGMLSSVVLCHSTLSYVVLWLAKLWYAVPCCAMLHRIAVCCAILGYVVLRCPVVLYCAILCYVAVCFPKLRFVVLLCYVVLDCAMLYYVVLCCPMFWWVATAVLQGVCSVSNSKEFVWFARNSCNLFEFPGFRSNNWTNPVSPTLFRPYLFKTSTSNQQKIANPTNP